MMTRIFHCDRCRDQAVLSTEELELPTGWTRVRQEGPEGGYTFVFCPRCGGYFREVLVTFGLGPK